MHLCPAMHGTAKLVNPAKNHRRVDQKFKRDLRLCTLCKVVRLMKMVNRTMYSKFELFESWGRAKTALIFPNTSWSGLHCLSIIVDDDQEHHVGEGLRLSAVFPAVADQSNMGAESSTALPTLVSFLSRCQGDRFGFVQLTLPLSPCYPVLLAEDRAFVDFAIPGRPV